MENKEKSQREWVVLQLKKNGFITRNQCLKNYISRLGSIIFRLKAKGFEFKAEFSKTKTLFGSDEDFVYTWTNSPQKIETEFTFVWMDEEANETPISIKADSFEKASSQFLSYSPIFLFAINEEVEDNFGNVHLLINNERFHDFKTYSKPKKRN